ncbi:fibronectin type III domain-containing protein [Flagellimonas meridianipacifica]|uniref:Fibronectin type-III domain-containing protein n=1 Tax=Flagellimonas meridianipacifica TaxID=1080225 RepID=A0A2T0MHZ6_9FLAO|nr:hypothetical protein [Allomuricauda pacifica]PRX57200.1 hypothetical protein CLV81_1203 [Allomuricauda pacifica]
MSNRLPLPLSRLCKRQNPPNLASRFQRRNEGKFKLFAVTAFFLMCFQANAQINYGTITIINSDTDTPVATVANNGTYYLDVVGSNITLDVAPPTSVGSVVFNTDIAEDQIESITPYAYRGDTGGDYNPWTTLPNYLGAPITFTIGYYSQSGGNGTLLGDDVFTITFEAQSPSQDTESPVIAAFFATAQGEDAIALSWNTSDNVGITSRSITYSDGNIPITTNSGNTTVTGLSAATNYTFTLAVGDAAGNSTSASDSATTNIAGSGNPPAGDADWSAGSGNDIYYNNGDVAIGRTSVPNGYKLAVDGNLRAREVRVDQENWPDYVFEDDYGLPSLEEIQKHITEKGHLPNMPSAKQVEAHGIELGKMDRLLLEKIEELTLYILMQQKRIEELEMEKSIEKRTVNPKKP